MDAILMSMPALIYVLAVSGAVHITNYYRQAVIHHGFDDAVERAIRHAWKPAFLCSITTGIGLASLHTSQIIPIAKFGDFSAIGVFAMLIILFLFLPATLKIWPWMPPEMRGARLPQATAEGRAREFAADHQGEVWVRFGDWVDRHNMAVMVCLLRGDRASVPGLAAGANTSIDLLEAVQQRRTTAGGLSLVRSSTSAASCRWSWWCGFPRNRRGRSGRGRGSGAGQLVARHTFLERMELVKRVEDVDPAAAGHPTARTWSAPRCRPPRLPPTSAAKGAARPTPRGGTWSTKTC